MIEVINLDFDYPERSLLRAINFSLKPGQLLHLRGANGAGKTTLLKVLAGLLQPTAGDIRFQGLSISADLSFYQRHLCYVGHKTGVSQLLTVRENCELSLRKERNVDLKNLLQQFSLHEFADVPCSHISAGQRRRVGLLRLFITDASLWLLDEPLNALDQEGITALIDSIKKHLAQQGQVILTSHQALPLQGVNYLEYNLGSLDAIN
jgi:heme exporter protein A